MKAGGGRAAFTLVELLVVIAIMVILAALILPNFRYFFFRAEQVVCTSKLKNLHDVFLDQLSDGNPWPQLPSGMTIGSNEEQQWWVTQGSNSLGLKLNDWQCPVFRILASKATNSSQNTLISYLPTLFDSNPSTPLNFPRMPWFTESGDYHTVGNLCVRADGSVSPAQGP